MAHFSHTGKISPVKQAESQKKRSNDTLFSPVTHTKAHKKTTEKYGVASSWKCCFFHLCVKARTGASNTKTFHLALILTQPTDFHMIARESLSHGGFKVYSTNFPSLFPTSPPRQMCPFDLGWFFHNMALGSIFQTCFFLFEVKFDDAVR